MLLVVSFSASAGDPVLVKRITTIDISGEVGNPQYDPGARLIFANIQTPKNNCW